MSWNESCITGKLNDEIYTVIQTRLRLLDVDTTTNIIAWLAQELQNIEPLQIPKFPRRWRTRQGIFAWAISLEAGITTQLHGPRDAAMQERGRADKGDPTTALSLTMQSR
jgi:hypothetical protein